MIQLGRNVHLSGGGFPTDHERERIWDHIELNFFFLGSAFIKCNIVYMGNHGTKTPLSALAS
jgi:hypothetical protein